MTFMVVDKVTSMVVGKFENRLRAELFVARQPLDKRWRYVVRPI